MSEEASRVISILLSLTEISGYTAGSQTCAYCVARGCEHHFLQVNAGYVISWERILRSYPFIFMFHEQSVMIMKLFGVINLLVTDFFLNVSILCI
jgi:hypothetical protein